MTLFLRCPHCEEYRRSESRLRPPLGTARRAEWDRLPDEVLDEPCDGCDELDAKLDYIAERGAA